MTVTPTSSAALIAEAVIDLVALSTTFQNRVAAYHNVAVSEANARLHIYGGEAFKPDVNLSDLYPFALVLTPQLAMRAVVYCSSLQYLPTGSVVLALFDEPRYTDCYGDDAPDDYNDSWVDALNWIHGTIDDMQGVAVADVAFRPNSIDAVEPVYRPDVTMRKTEDYWAGIFALTFGEDQ